MTDNRLTPVWSDLTQEQRQDRATSIYTAAMRRVASEPAPKGQKFPCGSMVRIADDLVHSGMGHFESGCDATVHHVYAHAYGGNNVTSYCLEIDGRGTVAWYDERQLTAIPGIEEIAT